MDEREVRAFERAPAALFHGRRGPAGHHVQAFGVVAVEQLMIAEFARDEGDGEGNRLAIGWPRAIVIQLPRLGGVRRRVDRAVAAQKQAMVPGGADIARV